MAELVVPSHEPIIAIVAPGQSGQEIGMGEEISRKSKAAERIWAITNNALCTRIGYDFTDLVWKRKINGMEVSKEVAAKELTQTPNTQVAVFSDTIARWVYGKEIGIIPEEIDAAGGLSLGRLAAAVITGAMQFNEGTVNLVRDRGEAFYKVKGWLVTLIDLDPDLVQEVREKGQQRIGENSFMYKSMNLTPYSFSVGGLEDSRADMETWLNDNGLEVKSDYVWPRVSGPFHTVLNKDARVAYAVSLKNARIVEPTNGVLIGNGGRILFDPEDTRLDLEEQTDVTEDFMGIGKALFRRGVTRIISLSARDPEANMLGEIATDPDVNREVIILPLPDSTEDKTLIGHQVLAA